jgi:threonine synthase
LPIRIAVAIVDGFSTGLPVTIGAAPAAWKPRMTGRRLATPSAASVAGVLAAHAEGWLEPGQTVVCTVTGNGLKDPDWAISGAPAPITIAADVEAAAIALELQA